MRRTAVVLPVVAAVCCAEIARRCAWILWPVGCQVYSVFASRPDTGDTEDDPVG